MSSNSRITHSKGPSDGTSLPPYTRPRKNMNTKADNTESMMTPTQKQTASDQLNNTVGHSPFARPSSQAGTSTMPANATQPAGSPFARPVAGLVRTQDSLTIYKAHLFHLSTVRCFHKITHQQAWI